MIMLTDHNFTTIYVINIQLCKTLARVSDILPFGDRTFLVPVRTSGCEAFSVNAEGIQK